MSDRGVHASGVHWESACAPALVACASAVAADRSSVGIVAQDATGAIVGANEQAAALLGLTWDQLVGRTSMDARWSAVSEHGLPLTGDQHPAMVTLATGEPVSGFLMGVMTPVDVGDLGRTVARTRWIEIGSHPVRDESGAVVGVVADFVDATDSARGQAASDAQWAALQLMIQNTDDVLLRASADGVVQWVSLSSSRVLGWSPGDLAGRDLDDLVHPDDVAGLRALRAAIRRDLTDEVSERTEVRIATPEGGWRWVSDAARALRDRDLGLAGEVHSLRDIEAEIAARRALAQSERRYRLIAENSSDVIVHVREDVIDWVSPSITQALGGDPDDWVGRDIRTVLDPQDYARSDPRIDALGPEESLIIRVRVTAMDGAIHWVDAHVRTYLRDDGEPDGVIASLRVVDDMVRAEAALEQQARFDALTGLANRAEMMTVVSRMVSAERRSGQETALLFCDLDGLKEINDRRGHIAGDEVLTVTGERIIQSVRKGDIAGRIGGDEFLVVLHGVRALPEALAVAEKVRAAVGEPIDLPDGPARVTASIGVTLLRPGESGDEVVGRADTAMYEAKRSGRDQVVAL